MYVAVLAMYAGYLVPIPTLSIAVAVDIVTDRTPLKIYFRGATKHLDTDTITIQIRKRQIQVTTTFIKIGNSSKRCCISVNFVFVCCFLLKIKEVNNKKKASFFNS